MTGILTLLGDVDEAVVSATRALEIAARLEDSLLRAAATYRLVSAHVYRGDYGQAVELASDHLAALATDLASESLGERRDSRLRLAAWERSFLLVSLAQLGRFVEASQYEAEAINLDEPRYARGSSATPTTPRACSTPKRANGQRRPRCTNAVAQHPT